MKKILLVGNFGARNVGDEIILWSALQKYPESIVLTSDGDFSRRFGEIKKSTTLIPPFPTGIRSFIKFIFSTKSREKTIKPLIDNHIEKIVFPGGGLFAIKLRAYVIWGITFWWLKKYLPEAEIIFEHQGIDETNCLLRKSIIKYICRKVNNISVRDEMSRNFLKTLNIDSTNKNDCVEFFLKESKLRSSPQKNLILINACRTNSATFQKLCTPNLMPQGTSCAFICFEPSDARYVPEKFKGKIIFPETIGETFKLFQKARTCIGQRLHFLILANYFCGATNTFTLEKPYSQKVHNFAKKYGIKEI